MVGESRMVALQDRRRDVLQLLLMLGVGKNMQNPDSREGCRQALGQERMSEKVAAEVASKWEICGLRLLQIQEWQARVEFTDRRSQPTVSIKTVDTQFNKRHANLPHRDSQRRYY